VALIKIDTTLELINNFKGNVAVGTLVETLGYASVGDGGGAQWKRTGNLLTASQSPAQLVDGLLNDAGGNQWALVVGNSIEVLQLGGLESLQAALNTSASVIIMGEESYIIPLGTTYTIKSNTKVLGAGMGKTVFFTHPNHPVDTALFAQSEISPDGVRTPENITLEGFTINGSNWLGYNPWLSAGNTTTAITDPEADYLAGGIIGLGGDIFDVVAANRRNASYGDRYNCIRMDKVSNPLIKNIEFISNVGFGVVDRGCFGMVVEGCVFIDHGKVDDISSCVWTQSYGTPLAGQSFYMPSENHVTRNCTFSCKRSAITLSPTKGGKFHNNTVVYSGESAIFSNSVCNVDGGSVDVYNNNFGKTALTDIAANHVENNGASNYHIYDNVFNESDFASVNMAGASVSSVRGNTFKNCVDKSVPNYPYGPFSERYGYNVGSASVAGNAVPDWAVIETGSLGSSGAEGQLISNNWFIDDKPTSLASGIVGLTKSGFNNLSDNISIIDNDRTGFLDTSVDMIHSPFAGTIMKPRMALTTRGNKNDASEVGKVESLQVSVGFTGIITVDVGFRPSKVRVYAALNSGTLGASFNGELFWEALPNGGATVKNGSGITDNNSNWAVIVDQPIYRINDGSGSQVCRAEFVAWTETGFSINVISSAQLTNVRLFCEA
jgi:hypothetical protein